MLKCSFNGCFPKMVLFLQLDSHWWFGRGGVDVGVTCVRCLMITLCECLLCTDFSRAEQQSMRLIPRVGLSHTHGQLCRTIPCVVGSRAHLRGPSCPKL